MENKILAKVDGVEITSTQVDNFIKRLDPQQAGQYNSEQGKQQILHELINQSLFLADAKATDLERSEEFEVEISKMKDMLLTQLSINKLMDSVKLNDDAVKAHFDANKAKFSKPEQTDTSHILVDTEDECNEILKNINSEDISFEDAAKKHSKCPSKDKGGNLGSFPRGKMVPEYEAAAFSLEQDEISNPVKTQFGYHLIKLNAKQEAVEAKFNEVKDQASKDLLALKQREVYTNKISQMRETYNVEMV